MTATLRHSARLLSIGTAIALLVMLGGCKPESKDANDQSQRPAVPTVTTPTHVTVDPMPEDSIEQSERHVWNKDGLEIERQITYRVTLNIETIKYRLDHTKISSHVETPAGIVLADLKYANDGTGVIAGFQKRKDGTLLFEVVQDSTTGATKTTNYWWDGKSVFMVLQVEQNGSYSAVMHHKNGKLWKKRYGNKLGMVSREESFAADGTLEYISEPNSTNGVQTLTYVRADGTVRMRQQMTTTSNYYGGSTNNLKVVEEFAADGKTPLRKITVETQSNSGYGYYGYGYGYNSSVSYADTVEEYNADGTVTISRLRRDGNVWKQEVRDADGKQVSDKTFDAKDTDVPKVTVDKALLTTPTIEDPQQRWQQTEQSDYSRNPEP